MAEPLAAGSAGRYGSARKSQGGSGWEPQFPATSTSPVRPVSVRSPKSPSDGPFLMLVAAWLHRRKGWSLARTTTIVLGGVVLVPSLAWSVSYTAASPAEAFFVTTTRLWELAIGAFVAAAGVRLAPNTRLSAAVRSAGLIGIVATAVLVAERVAWPSYWALLPTVATAAVIAAGAETSGSDKVAGLLQSQPMQRIGAWSYSIYLWHWPPLAILAATGVELDPAMAMLVTVVACVPAVLSYRLLENPVRFAKPLVSSPGLSLSLGANLTLCGALAGVLLVMAIPRTAGPDTSDASAVGSASRMPRCRGRGSGRPRSCAVGGGRRWPCAPGQACRDRW